MCVLLFVASKLISTRGYRRVEYVASALYDRSWCSTDKLVLGDYRLIHVIQRRAECSRLLNLRKHDLSMDGWATELLSWADNSATSAHAQVCAVLSIIFTSLYHAAIRPSRPLPRPHLSSAPFPLILLDCQMWNE